MSLLDRLRDLLGSAGNAGAANAGSAAKRRARNQAQPLTPGGVRSYDASEPGRPMARAQWIGLGLAAALAVALTAGLVFIIMSFITPSSRPTATPTALPVAVVSPSPNNSSIADIFATLTPTPIASPTVPRPPAIGQRLQVANTGNDGVNLRRDPGQNGERIKTVREGTVVDVVGADQVIDGTIWRNVRDTQGDQGWIAANFLAPEGTASSVSAIPGSEQQPSASGTSTTGSAPAATAVPKPTSPGVAASGAGRGQIGNTNGQGANIRSEPGSGGRVLKTLAEGSNIEVLGPEREVDGQIWRQVRDSSGVTGWIIRGAVAPSGSVPTPVAPAATRAATTPQPAATQAPGAPKPTTGTSGAPPTTAPAAPKPTTPPSTPNSNLPIIIQPATPRPSGGAAPTATPRP